MRKEIIGTAELYLGDAFEVLPTLSKVDALVLDPPYELSSTSPGTSHFGMSLDKFDSDNYKAITSGFDMQRLFPMLEALCQPFNMFCFCSNKQISRLMAYHEAKGRITTLLVWHKTNAAPFANGVWRGDIEYCVHARDTGAVFQGDAKEKCKVFPHPIVQDSLHPSVKPLALVSRHIKICSHEGQTILDPFMGSGTTGIAAGRLGRKFIGIEIDQRHFDTSCRQIELAQSQPDFFIEEKSYQEKLILNP